MALKLPKIITKEEYEKLFKAVQKTKHKKKKEYLLAFILAAEAGLRISEIVGFKKRKSRCCSADVIEKRIKQEGQRKSKKIFFCMKCEKILLIKDMKRTSKNEWAIEPLTKDKVDLEGHRIEIKGAKGGKDRIVVCPKKVNQAAIKLLPLKIKRRALQRFVTQLGWDVLIKGISIHTLRHYFGTQCAEKMQLHQVQMLMGHASLSTTGIYLHANPKQAIEAAREVF